MVNKNNTLKRVFLNLFDAFVNTETNSRKLHENVNFFLMITHAHMLF